MITSSVKAKEKIAAKVIETSDPKACQNQQSLCLTEECIVSGIFLYGLYSVNLISQNDYMVIISWATHRIDGSSSGSLRRFLSILLWRMDEEARCTKGSSQEQSI